MSEAPIPEPRFRELFPAFIDLVRFPTAQVELYLDLAFKQLDVRRWGDMHDLGQQLFVAHLLTLDDLDTQAGARGNANGAQPGVVTSKSVGGVSLSYDTSSVMEQGAGFWNATSYGRRFWRFMRLAGMSPIHIR